MKAYTYLTDDKTFAFSAENPTGARGGGSRGGDCTKLSPTVRIAAGECVTLAGIQGPGLIQNMWFTGYVGHGFILRIYWDEQPYPSVEAPLSAFFGCAYDENFVDRDGCYPVLNSAVMLVAAGRGYNCFFEMPFKKRCRITMENRGEQAQELYYIITGCRRELPDNIACFSAHYSGLFAILGDNREFYNGQQRFLLYRFHVPDPIHFETGFRMTIDNMGWTGPRYDDYTSVAYWYQSLPSARLKELPSHREMCMR